MRRIMTVLMLAVVTIWAISFAMAADDQEPAGSGTKEGTASMQQGSMGETGSGMKQGEMEVQQKMPRRMDWSKMTPDEMSDHCVKSMKAAGVSAPMRMRYMMMMNSRMAPANPDGLIALKSELKLSDEQVSRLQSIAAKAREDASAVLTDEQRAQVSQMADTPDTLMGMNKSVMKHMKGKGAMMRGGMCPMCPMMGDHKMMMQRKMHQGGMMQGEMHQGGMMGGSSSSGGEEEQAK